MNKLEELKQKRLEALKNYDYVMLNEINKQIFALREKARKEKERQKQLERDAKFDKFVTEKCELCL